jgi:hypothetical protein
VTSPFPFYPLLLQDNGKVILLQKIPMKAALHNSGKIKATAQQFDLLNEKHPPKSIAALSEETISKKIITI